MSQKVRVFAVVLYKDTKWIHDGGNCSECYELEREFVGYEKRYLYIDVDPNLIINTEEGTTITRKLKSLPKIPKSALPKKYQDIREPLYECWGSGHCGEHRIRDYRDARIIRYSDSTQSTNNDICRKTRILYSTDVSYSESD